jgi:hypothetical protein
MEPAIMPVQTWWSNLPFQTVAALFLTLDFPFLLQAAVGTPPAEGLTQMAICVVLEASLLHRVSEGSKGPWLALLLLTALPIPLLPFWIPEVSKLLALPLALQAGLLLHPAIRHRAGVGRPPASSHAENFV